jgi:hypothetical protein
VPAADLHRQLKGDLWKAHRTAGPVATLPDRYDHAMKDAHKINVERRIAAIDTTAGFAALGHPARCVAWLAPKLGSLSTGLKAGDVFRAEYAHLGPVTVRFSTEGSE